MKDFSLSREDTAILKGIAICAMLIHHMYGCSINPNIQHYDGILKWLGILGKICVSIFLFCSGYGLSVQYRPVTSFKESIKFVLRRFVKFYTNYWPILIIFVGISCLISDRTITTAYAGLNIYKRILFEFLAINGGYSFNITWWFNKLIIFLYLGFPVLYWICKRSKLFGFLISIALFRFGGLLHIYSEINLFTWQFPFVLGILWALLESSLSPLVEFINKKRIISLLLILALLFVLVYLRMNEVSAFWYGFSIDPILTCTLALSILLFRDTWPHNRFLWPSLSFLGKHSMTIYLIHTFFNLYWHPEWLHTAKWMRTGINFFVLMSICLAISCLLEYLKKRTGINKISEKAISVINNLF